MLPRSTDANAASLAHRVANPSSSNRPHPQADLASAETVPLNMVGRTPSIASQ